MPYLRVDTNLPVRGGKDKNICEKLSAFTAKLLGKPETYVLCHVLGEQALSHGGSFDPAAFVTLKSIGLPANRTTEFSAAICGFLEKELGIPPNRVYIDFADLERTLFGWDSRTF